MNANESYSPKINTTEMGVEVVTKGHSWSGSDTPMKLRAGVNSFGYGGANGHAILESAAYHVPRNYASASEIIPTGRTKYILPVSASTTDSLDARVRDLAAYNLEGISIQDLAYTLGSRRSHLARRGYLLASAASIQNDVSAENLKTIPSQPASLPSQYGFVFTGQGAQWPQMCMELFEEFPVFRHAIADMDSALQKLPHPPKWNLKEVIFAPKDSSHVMDPTYSQPVCTSVQVGLVLLLQSWGIASSVVVGHSSGEIAAAFAAGFISLEEAITIAYYRGYMVNKNALDGGMIAAGLSREEAEKMIGSLGLEGKIRVACVNSPSSVTISGDGPAIDELLNELR